MDRQRPPRAWSRAWLTIWAAAALAACQGLPQLSLSDTSSPPGPGWRVVERLGEARYLAPGMAGWQAIVAGGMIPTGSQISTGIGGRLIVQQADNQLSAGTGSRFILPGWEPGGNLRQTAGWLRYRIATPPSATFGIETPFLDLMVDDAVLDVTVGDSETEVAVVSGRVRVKTLDERRQIELQAGYTGYASLQGEPLAVRRGPGRSLETVPPLVLPALHPNRPASARVAPGPAGTAAAIAAVARRAPETAKSPADPSTANTAVLQPPGPSAPGAAQPPATAVPADGAIATPVAAPAVPAAATPAAAEPVAAAVPGRDGAAPGIAGPPDEILAQGASAPANADQAEQIRRRFDGLTEGLLDGLLPALPQGPQRDGR